MSPGLDDVGAECAYTGTPFCLSTAPGTTFGESEMTSGLTRAFGMRVSIGMNNACCAGPVTPSELTRCKTRTGLMLLSDTINV